MGFVRGIVFRVLLLCLVSSAAWAAVCEKFLVQANVLAQGERVRLQFDNDPTQADAIFLGRLVTIEGVSRELLFYEPARQLVHVIPLAKTTLKHATTGEPISPDEARAVVRSVNQEGGTCAAYSIFNCMRQLHYAGARGNELLAKELSSEAGRMGLLVRVVNQVYIENNNDIRVLGALTEKYGFSYAELPWKKPDELKEKVWANLSMGRPVLLRFDVPMEMSETPYTIVDRSTDEPMTRRLWTPKKWLQRAKAGHMVLALGVFEVNGERKLLVTDPNWQVPRFWDSSELDKARGASIRAFVVWQHSQSR